MNENELARFSHKQTAAFIITVLCIGFTIGIVYIAAITYFQ